MKIEIWDEVSESESDWYKMVMERVRQKQAKCVEFQYLDSRFGEWIGLTIESKQQKAKDKDVLQGYDKEPDQPETQPDQSP